MIQEQSTILQLSEELPYTSVPNKVLRNEKLSLKAKGLLCIMLSYAKMEGWKFNRNHLMKLSTDGDTSFRTALKEIKDCGFLTIESIKEKDTQKIKYWKWTLLTENIFSVHEPHVENPHVGKPHVGNKHYTNNNIKNKDNTNTLSGSRKKPDTIPYKNIIDYLNEKASTNYRHTSKHVQRSIKARWGEGFTLEDFKKVIDNCTARWLHDDRMTDYLRPQTLFNTKFDSYLNMRSGLNGAKTGMAREAKDMSGWDEKYKVYGEDIRVDN